MSSVQLMDASVVSMETAIINIRNSVTLDATYRRAVLDTGSNKTYIMESHAKTLKLEKQFDENLTVYVLGTSKPKQIQ